MTIGRFTCTFTFALAGASCTPLGAETECGSRQWAELGVETYCDQQAECRAGYGLIAGEERLASRATCKAELYDSPFLRDSGRVDRSGGCTERLNCDFTWQAISTEDCELYLDIQITDVECYE